LCLLRHLCGIWAEKVHNGLVLAKHNTFHVYTMGTWIWNMVLSQAHPRSPVYGALLKRGRKGHMKTITYSGRCQVHTIASGKGIWARPIGNFAQQFQSWASYKY